jgi:hypothetical protein
MVKFWQLSRNPGWRIPGFAAYSLVIARIFQPGFLENRVIRGELPDICKPNP